MTDRIRERAEKLAHDLPVNRLQYWPSVQAIESALREYGDERENEGLEKVAKYVDGRPYGYRSFGDDIRALKSERLSVGQGERK